MPFGLESLTGGGGISTSSASGDAAGRSSTGNIMFGTFAPSSGPPAWVFGAALAVAALLVVVWLISKKR